MIGLSFSLVAQRLNFQSPGLFPVEIFGESFVCNKAFISLKDSFGGFDSDHELLLHMTIKRIVLT